MPKAVGGTIRIRANGAVIPAKGSWSWNLGRPMREPIIGADGRHGFKELPQVAYIEGATTFDGQSFDLAALVSLRDATVTLELANGTVLVLPNAYFAGEGSGSTDEGEVAVRFEGDPIEIL